MELRDVVVAGVGMVSAVGLSAPEVAASTRAGVMRLAESRFLDRSFTPFTLAEVPGGGLPRPRPGPHGRRLGKRETRMLRLAAAAFAECLAFLPPGAGAPPLAAALPETGTERPVDEGGFLDALAVQAGGFDRERSEAVFRGRAGGLSAIARAAGWLGAGAPFAVAGGVDTYRDRQVLEVLDREQRVKSQANLDGFVPGEGAAFLLLARRGVAAPIAALSAFGAGVEPGHLYSAEPYLGNGLAGAVAAALGDGMGPVAEVYSSMNGESHWAREWGVAALRNQARLGAQHRMHHPADGHGDTGAAAGPLMTGLAALGIRDGYRGSPCLVYGSSDRGERAALVVSVP